MVSLEVIAILLSGISISASLFYYANVLANANKTREKELISQRLSTITPEFYSNTSKLFKGEWSTQLEWIDHLKEHPEDSQVSSFIMVHFNSLGVLLKNQILSHNLVFSVYAPHYIIWIWEKLCPIIRGNRELINYSELMMGFEFLYNEAKQEYPEIVTRDVYLRNLSDLQNR